MILFTLIVIFTLDRSNFTDSITRKIKNLDFNSSISRKEIVTVHLSILHGRDL